MTTEKRSNENNHLISFICSLPFWWLGVTGYQAAMLHSKNPDFLEIYSWEKVIGIISIHSTNISSRFTQRCDRFSSGRNSNCIRIIKDSRAIIVAAINIILLKVKHYRMMKYDLLPTIITTVNTARIFFSFHILKHDFTIEHLVLVIV